MVQNNGESSAIYKFQISKGIKKLLYLFQKPLEKRSFSNVDLLYILDERLKAFLPSNSTIIKKQTLGVITERFIPLDKKRSKKNIKSGSGQKVFTLYR